MLQVRDLPDEVHDRLKERAAAERMSLSSYVARELTRLVRYRTNEEVLRQARESTAVLDRKTALEAVQQSRDDR